ncbi:MAG: Regulator of RpoS [Anaerolineae bacterium]|nr:Regulator of RpoS [Anaerolineae bacterium]
MAAAAGQWDEVPNPAIFSFAPNHAILRQNRWGYTAIAKILVVEDNKQNALLMKRVLEVNNHEVIHVSDGESGLTTAIEEQPDLILVDLGLPDIDGQTLVALIKRVDELKDVPTVAVTAWPEDTAREMALAYGCDGFISKPINTRAFPDQIAAFLTKKP